MHSNTLCKRTISVAESGMTTLRFKVQHDEDEDIQVTLEEQLPDAVDLDTVAVGPSDGKWAVYDDGTAQWSVSVRPTEVATATIGVVCTDPDAVDALADDASSHVIVGGPPAPPGVDDQAVDTIEPGSLESATARERVPESVYERVREIEDGAFDTDVAVQPTAASTPDAGGTGSDTAPSETAPEGSGGETTAATTDHAQGGTDHDALGGADDATAEAAAGAEWPGDPLENALRVQDQQSRADETAYRFGLSFDDAGNDAAVAVLEGLLNGTTVFGADPTLPDLQRGAEPDELTVTISSALDEDALVGALEDVEHATLTSFETLDVDLTASDLPQSNAAEQFREVDDATERADYDEYEDEVDDIEEGAFDFGDEPVSFADLVENPGAAHEAVADTEFEDESDDDAAVHEERVTERLLAELDEGGVSERERIELRRRLGVDPQTSTEVRLDHLHARVEELAAYTDALEAFLDEEGTAQTLLSDLAEDVTELASRTEELDDRVETEASAATAERESLEQQLAALSEAREDDRERIDDLTDTVERNSDDVDQLSDTVERNANDVDQLSDTVERNSDDVDQLAEDVDARLEALQESVDGLETMASTLDERLADVEDTLAALEETVEENSRVREGLKSLTT